MSKKYVPSFLKDQQSTSNPTQKAEKAESASFWPGRPGVTGSTAVNAVINTNSNNKFAVLSDDFPMNRPVVNTSRPAVDAPKLAPMTLASATSNGAVPMGGAGGPSVLGAGVGAGAGPKKSFASKFAEQAKITSNPNYKPPPKPINFQSEEDFPSLGGKPVNTVITKSEVTGTTGATGATGTNFADMAKGWAKHKEDEEERARIKAEQEEKLRREAIMMRSIPILGAFRRTAATKDNYHNEDEEDSHNYEESSLGDDDSYEVPEGDTEPSDEDDENGEFNSDVGWDGRKRGDLY